MRISLSTLRKIIRESVESTAVEDEKHITADDVISELARNHIPLQAYGDKMGVIVNQEGENVYIIVPDTVTEWYDSYNYTTQHLLKTIGDTLKTKFGRVLKAKGERINLNRHHGSDPATSYLVESPKDENKGYTNPARK
jgi:hypothetical protein